MKSKLLLITCILLSHQLFSQELLVDTIYRKFNTLVATNAVNRFTQKKIALPNEVKAVSNEQIKSFTGLTSSELLMNTGTIYVRNLFQGGASPIVRGFEGSRIGLYVDGIRLNTLITGTNYNQNILCVDPNLLENIEVVNGPSSSNYGTDALGGAIHLRTRMPELSTDTLGGKVFTGNIFTKYNTANQGQTYHLDFNYGDGRTAILTSFSYMSFGDLRMGAKANPFSTDTYTRDFNVEYVNAKDSAVKSADNLLQKGSGYNQLFGTVKVLYKPEENISHLLNFQYSNTSEMNNYGQLNEVNSKGRPIYAKSTVGPQNRIIGSYELNIQPDSTFFDNLKLGINFQDFQTSISNRLYKKENEEYTYNDHMQIINLFADFSRQYGKHLIHYGLDAQYNSLQSKANPNNTIDSTNYKRQALNPKGGSTVNNVSAYINHTLQLSENLMLTDGLRFGYNSLSTKFESVEAKDLTYYHLQLPAKVSQSMPVFCLNAGLVYRPTLKIKLSGLISTGYRAPNISDISSVFGSSSGFAIVPNTKIKAEYANNFDLGATYWFNDNMWIEQTFYATLLNNALALAKDQYNGSDTTNYYYINATFNKKYVNSQVYSLQNVERATVLGSTTKFNFSFAKNWQITACFNYTSGKISKPTAVYLAHVPPAFANLSVKYSKRKITAILFSNFNSEKPYGRYGNPAVDMAQYGGKTGVAAWYTINLNLQYRINDKWNLQAGVDNILDTQYRTFGSGITASGRNIYGALKFTW
jgi:hemoglobin/transferrin/lactoferrin receptor protein